MKAAVEKPKGDDGGAAKDKAMAAMKAAKERGADPIDEEKK